MKRYLICIVCLLITCSVLGQDNYFTFNGNADVKLRCLSRGTGGRAIAHLHNNILVLNYSSDFTGGTQIHSPLVVGGDLTTNGGITAKKLDVNGIIRSKEVKIEATGWSDFVFDEKYQLPSLSEVENHIKEHKHLPDIPSEREVVENGISVGEMQAKLLQKIEELTLYVIEQDKKFNVLKQENEVMKQENKEIKQEIKMLKETK